MRKLNTRNFFLVVSILFLTNLSFGQFIVTTNADNGPGSLREAVLMANTTPGANTITFDNNYTISLSTGDIVIKDDLVITGTGIGNTIFDGSSNGNDRLIGAIGFTNLEISGITFKNSTSNFDAGALGISNVVLAKITDCEFESNATNGMRGAGALGVTVTNLIVDRCLFNNNMATNTVMSSGGAIGQDTSGTITVLNSSFTNNRTNRAGGAIEVNSPDSIVISSTSFNNNMAAGPPGNGGAIHITGSASSSITASTFSGNTSTREGGALWNGSGTMILDGVTITGNSVATTESSIDDGGGGVFNNTGSLVIVNGSFISGNSVTGAAASGGGILNFRGTLNVTDSEISGNTAVRAGGGIEDNSTVNLGSITLFNVILDSNNAGDAPGNGGGLHMTGPGTSTITNATVTGNIASAEGGGLWNGSGTMMVEGTSIDGNIASGLDANEGGGGIFNAGGTLFIENGSTITNNIADGASGSGGGILNDMGTLTVTDSELSENTSMRAGGGIEDNSIAGNTLTLTNVNLIGNVASAAPGNGGGVHISGMGDAIILGGSATGNIAASEGGGIWNSVGNMSIDGMKIDGNIAQGVAPDNGGGGIFNNGGTLDIINGTIISNNLVIGSLGSGGGLLSTAGNVTVSDSFFSSNAANRAGGAIEIIDGDLTFINSEMIGNDVNGVAGTPAPGSGGGLHVTGTTGLIEISSSSISNNTAANQGGGLWNQNGTSMTISGSTIDNNTANEGGGFYNNTGGIAILNRSTVSGNTALISGGGIQNDGASLDLNAVTIAMNNAANSGGGIESNTATSLKNTLVALNTANVRLDVNGIFVSNDYNLIGTDDAGAFTPQANDVEEVDPVLGPLQNNGGTTNTHQLLLGSPAYNAGDLDDLFVDQIGQAVFGGIRDIGSYESQVTLLGTEDISGNDTDIVIHPNPSKGEIAVLIPDAFGQNIQMIIIEVGSGKTVDKFTANTGNTSFTLDGLSNGVYIVKIVSDKRTSSHRLILAR